jgi:hypothetical protein
MDDDRIEKVLAVIHQNVARGETVNKQFYLNVLKCVRAAVRRKRPEGWTDNTWMLHRDSAPAHASLFRAIPQNTFQDTFQNWKKLWERCIKSGGESSEGDKFD